MGEIRARASCHSERRGDAPGLPVVAIVGPPNVGKSVLFNALTGARVTVSNYPGTTVEIARGKARVAGMEIGVVDTPGMYGLLPVTEEEAVARRILLEERPALVVHVVDAKGLERMLPMTFQLIEAGFPLVLVVNMMDEAERLGLEVDVAALERELGIPVVATSLIRGRGLSELKGIIATRIESPPQAAVSLTYARPIEEAAGEIAARLRGPYAISHRAIALLLLQGDPGIAALVREREGPRADAILSIAERAQARSGPPIPVTIARQRREVARRLLRSALRSTGRRAPGFAARLSEAMMRPLTGIPLLILALFLLYELVGVLGAQVMVDFLEEDVFGRYINPWVNRLLNAYVPWEAVRELIGGQYGVITLGLRYAVAIILPIVGTFFLAFSLIEDSGYLPRLAMLIDRVFKKIGLSGRAVIPLVLGFGCDTMATIVTRTLETRRERLLATLLLALAIPCSAQLGVLMGLLAGRAVLLIAWAGLVGLVFLLVGLLASRLLPGERPSFYMELPPLRLPRLGNVLVKTYTRMEWYFREVLPLFVLASVFIWLGRLTGLFEAVTGALVPLVRWIGLPDEAAVAFLFGFFRRDYGAAGLYDLRPILTGPQLLVASVTLTLFVPCIAQFSVMFRERGWRTALTIVLFIFPFAFLVGGLVFRVLAALGLGQ